MDILIPRSLVDDMLMIVDNFTRGSVQYIFFLIAKYRVKKKKKKKMEKEMQRMICIRLKYTPERTESSTSDSRYYIACKVSPTEYCTAYLKLCCYIVLLVVVVVTSCTFNSCSSKPQFCQKLYNLTSDYCRVILSLFSLRKCQMVVYIYSPHHPP